jgi:hypothetical protein
MAFFTCTPEVPAKFSYTRFQREKQVKNTCGELACPELVEGSNPLFSDF